mmetsp:Transcript_29679/g.52452  ORF Transcript_29679/g.52452 Transcript_29679/m.52452 type:complete len:279 (-) Transcript_29679:923-1759(-)
MLTLRTDPCIPFLGQRAIFPVGALAAVQFVLWNCPTFGIESHAVREQLVIPGLLVACHYSTRLANQSSVCVHHDRGPATIACHLLAFTSRIDHLHQICLGSPDKLEVGCEHSVVSSIVESDLPRTGIISQCWRAITEPVECHVFDNSASIKSHCTQWLVHTKPSCIPKARGDAEPPAASLFRIDFCASHLKIALRSPVKSGSGASVANCLASIDQSHVLDNQRSSITVHAHHGAVRDNQIFNGTTLLCLHVCLWGRDLARTDLPSASSASFHNDAIAT